MIEEANYVVCGGCEVSVACSHGMLKRYTCPDDARLAIAEGLDCRLLTNIIGLDCNNNNYDNNNNKHVIIIFIILLFVITITIIAKKVYL
jgi:hypothetical protein